MISSNQLRKHSINSKIGLECLLLSFKKRIFLYTIDFGRHYWEMTIFLYRPFTKRNAFFFFFFLLISKRSLPIFFFRSRRSDSVDLAHHPSPFINDVKKKADPKNSANRDWIKKKITRRFLSLSSSQSETNQIHWIKKKKKKTFFFCQRNWLDFLSFDCVFFKEKKKKKVQHTPSNMNHPRMCAADD